MPMLKIPPPKVFHTVGGRIALICPKITYYLTIANVNKCFNFQNDRIRKDFGLKKELECTLNFQLIWVY